MVDISSIIEILSACAHKFRQSLIPLFYQMNIIRKEKFQI